ncbi:MAG: type II toxin-antitoxin system HipA family toxin [Brevundimonas sp.]|uniref:type II toxin-antitoxin system HipA family toxin n=1 Tax=Brevundimonas sp. TaxID=1871086 RepID=UPI003918EB67
MADDSLVLLLDGQTIGVIRRRQGRLSLTYDDAWRLRPNAYPLSLSMPLAAAEHPHGPVNAFLWGLLPDNELVIARWARHFQISPKNPFALIGAVGEDCAGAVQFVRPERLAALQDGVEDSVDWLDRRQVAERLKALREDQAAWRAARDTGQFSLAGAQPKTALMWDDGRWGVPSGRLPTTHILKPPTASFDGHAENEHLCLSLARHLGLPAAHSRVDIFEDEIAIVVERYDRLRIGNRIARVHQEDFCQALAHLPSEKYQNEGGPGVKECVAVLAEQSSEPGEDIDTFLDAVIFNWLVAGTDAHAKNYSILLSGGGRVRLAPLYDIASALPYPGLDYQKLKLAMKLGGECRLRNLGARHVERMAKEARKSPNHCLGRVRDLAGRIPGAVAVVANEMRAAGLEHEIVGRLSELITNRAREIEAVLSA